MENYTFNLNEADVEQELKCVICFNLPSEPLQCQGCDSIMCKECSKRMGSPFKCPLRCKNPNYGKVKPKTMLLFDHLTLRCEKCLKTFKYLESANHEVKCGRSSNIFASDDDNESTEQPGTKPFDQYQMSDSQKKLAKVMRKKTVEATEPLQTPFISNDDIIEIFRPHQVIERRQRSRQWYFYGLIIGLVTLFMMWKFASTCIKMIFLDSNLKFKWICQGYDSMDEMEDIHDLCFISYGGFAVGIIALGQTAIGLFSFCQFGIGLLFGFGQVIGGCGVAIGQLAASFYVYAAMFGVAFYRAKYTVAVNYLYALFFSKEYCVDNCNLSYGAGN